MPARTTLLLEVFLSSRLSRLTRTWWGGALLAAGLVAVALGLRLILDDVVLTHYLLMAPAVIVTALLAGRSSVLVAIVLSVAADALLARRASMLELVVTALLFAGLTLAIAEIGRRLIEAVRHSNGLARDLARREALLDAILASAPVVALNDQQKISRISQAATALLGVTSEAVVGRPFTDLVPAFDLTQARAPATTGSGLWMGHGPDGSRIPLTIQVADLPHPPYRTVLTLADQRRAEVFHEQAQLFQGRLATASRLKFMGEMAASLAHEINQPLTAATVYLHAGQAEIARAGLMGDSVRTTLDMAKAQLLRAGEILRRVRERIDAGGQALKAEPAASILNDLSPLFGLIAHDTGVSIRIEAADPDVDVIADRLHVQQAVANLVRNAVDAAMGGDAAEVLITGRGVDDGDYEIRVEDTGPGIPEDQVDFLFQPMKKTTKTGGMGLGLSVTRSIVEAHDGVLAIDRSATLGGAAFSFRLTSARKLEAA